MTAHIALIALIAALVPSVALAGGFECHDPSIGREARLLPDGDGFRLEVRETIGGAGSWERVDQGMACVFAPSDGRVVECRGERVTLTTSLSSSLAVTGVDDGTIRELRGRSLKLKTMGVDDPEREWRDWDLREAACEAR
jgi:hypothetical protein